ncbi:heavy metal translocating P-type ATPase [Mycobacteroides abscessus]|uniref:heavy metal translocating P-type ATPase n=2 Tax=Mycobacteriaceae TaxID=1762 RepID=UPI000316DA18|nr:cation-translocating P-type ATPase [Mycobacteroides abscessus]CPT79213.1 heavy metal translocating P-type ATPase [Mycobacteroides abscessus]CPU63260.1 heavy metal translocating P-type ATPase [Mycobacteroides abscessus]SKK67821.1 heavy metal translocating P-type ATPase [Mycobacteroides abscessus subsp. massiliense]SKQ42539.1 heavy metal translocating P-type ATPase [Mycobacteroides abscessus subsp. massiliense]SKW99013.1 heavy metal translocating P-type ATPase [Mycobacteroides abscessus subsp
MSKHHTAAGSNRWKKLLTLLAAASFAVGLIANVLKLSHADWVFVVSLATGGLPVGLAATRGLVRGRITINLLVTVAALGALYLGEVVEAAAVVFFFALAEAFEEFGEARSQRAVAALIEHSPTVARLTDGREMPVDQVQPGTIIAVRPGDTVPLDGVVVAGESSIDEAAITGEAVPKEKYRGQTVFAGTSNQNGYLEIEVATSAANSVLARIVTLIGQAQKSRPDIQNFLDRFASYYIPAAVGVAVLVAVVPPLLFHQPFGAWFTRALILLVLACPDALVVSAPVAVAAAIGGASRKGVLIKGGRSLEVLSKVKAAAFDKTKTLTVGVPAVSDVVALHGATESDVLGDAAGLEKFSSHPLAEAIEQRAAERGVTAHDMDTFANVAGRGASANCLVCTTTEHAIGNLAHIGANATTCEEVLREVDRLESAGQTAVLVSEGSTVIGVIGITDELRPETPAVITALRKLGVTPVMLTGDNQRAAHAVARRVGISDAYGGLLPEQKADLIDTLQTTYGTVAMIGDGVNDAPSLARADVGIAMGGGSDVAIETADIALMNDAIAAIPYLLHLGQTTFRVIKQNVYGSLIVKALILITGIAGLTGLSLAVAIDAVTAILVVLNGLRLFGTGSTPVRGLAAVPQFRQL